jgi:hypothetical protein
MLCSSVGVDMPDIESCGLRATYAFSSLDPFGPGGVESYLLDQFFNRPEWGFTVPSQRNR